jgi:hypothetical protein
MTTPLVEKWVWTIIETGYLESTQCRDWQRGKKKGVINLLRTALKKPLPPHWLNAAFELHKNIRRYDRGLRLKFPFQDELDALRKKRRNK